MKIGCGFIYITKNNINNKLYIGQKTYTKDYKTYLGSGKNITLAVKKYGKENFTRTIIEYCETMKELNEREIFWIKYFNAVDSKIFYNLAIGGNGVVIQNRVGRKGYNNKNSKLLVCLNNEMIYSCSRSASDYFNLHPSTINECCNGIRKYLINKKTKERLVFVFYKDYKKMSKKDIEIIIANVNNMGKGENSNTSRSVVCLNDNIIFKTENEAMNFYSEMHRTRLIECCKGKSSCCGTDKNGNKLTWMYYEDYILATDEFIKEKIDKTFHVSGIKRKVVCLNDKIVFDSIKDANIHYGLNDKGHITSCCKGKRNYAGKHPVSNQPLKWMYYEDYIKMKEG